MSYKPEVIAGRSNEWTGNALRFATEREAEIFVRDLARRWTLVVDWRVVHSDDPVNWRAVVDEESKTFRLVELPRLVKEPNPPEEAR
jgi:hypothetical protein